MKGLGLTRILKIMDEFRQAKNDMKTRGQIEGWGGVGEWGNGHVISLNLKISSAKD